MYICQTKSHEVDFVIGNETQRNYLQNLMSQRGEEGLLERVLITKTDFQTRDSLERGVN